MLEFKYDDFRITCPANYYIFLKEVFLLDIYRANLIKQNSIVLDLGADYGDFSIVASKKVGKNGKVIALEPNPDDFELLKENIKKK